MATEVMQRVRLSIITVFYVALTARADIRPTMLTGSALSADDSCLSGQECGADLMQRSSGYNQIDHQRRNSVRQATRRQSSSRTSNAEVEADKADAHYSSSLSLLRDVREFVASVKDSGRSAAEVNRLAGEYTHLLDTGAVANISASFQEHQRALQSHTAGFRHCDTDLTTRLDEGQELQTVFEGWEKMCAECRAHQEILDKDLVECNTKLQVALTSKETACSSLNASDPAEKERDDAHVLSILQACEGASQSATDQSNVCADGQRLSEMKHTECAATHQSMEAANCARAAHVSGVCDMYDMCRAHMSLAYTNAKEAAQAWERYHKMEMTAMETVRCMSQHLTDDNHSLMLAQLQHCEELVSNSSSLDLEYGNVPAAIPCTPVNERPCAMHVPAAQDNVRQPTSSYARAAASADAVDESGEELSTAVSFMQEGLERARATMPNEIHETLLGPWSKPIIVALVALFGMLVVGKGMLHLKEGRRVEQDGCELLKGNDGQSNVWLCPELIVPQNSKCQITVPALGSARTEATSFMITDKMGQPLFKASMARLPKQADGVSNASHAENWTLTRQDGMALASCSLVSSSGSQCSTPECTIFQRDGQPFAYLKTNCSQASWLSRILKKAAGDSTRTFVFASSCPGAWQVRVQIQSPSERALHIVDGSSRLMATVERSNSFVQGDKNKQEFYKVEAGSAADTDLGLITIALLAADRIVSTQLE